MTVQQEPPSDDHVLIDRAVAGDRDAFWELLHRYDRRLRAMIVRYAWRIPPADRDDYQSYLRELLFRRIGGYRAGDTDFLRYLAYCARREQRSFLEHRNYRPLPGPTVPLSETRPDDGGRPFELPASAPLPLDRLSARAALDSLLTRLFQLDTAPHHLLVFCFNRVLCWTPDAVVESEVWTCRTRALLAIVATAVLEESDREVRIGPALAPLEQRMDATLGGVLSNTQLRETYVDLLDARVGDLSLCDYYVAFRAAALRRHMEEGCGDSASWQPPTPQKAITKWCEYVVKVVHKFAERRGAAAGGPRGMTS